MAKQKRSPPKPCELCHTLSPIRYRIQYDQRGLWVLACPTCQAHHSTENAFYRYGGTWKARGPQA